MARPVLKDNRALILCVTGTRADYGIYRPLLWEIYREPSFRLGVIVTGMHLAEEFGFTVKEVREDPFEIIAAPPILTRGDSTAAMAQSTGLALLYFSDIFSFQNPWLALILGDRGEMLAAAIAAHYQNIGIAHLHGGEHSGSADDAVRHAISRFAHLHFAATRECENNLLRSGEEAWRVTAVGSLRKHDISALHSVPAPVRKAWDKKYSLESPSRKVLVVMHPDSKEEIPAERQVGAVVSALTGLGGVIMMIVGSNSDAGRNLFRGELVRLADQKPGSLYMESIPSLEYLYLLSRADLIIGNSSSGIIEAPFFSLPFVNVGNRQAGREAAANVYPVPYDAGRIRETARELLCKPRINVEQNPYDLLESPAKAIVQKLKQAVLMGRPRLFKSGCRS